LVSYAFFDEGALTAISQDEAYELGHQWAQIYDVDSLSRKLITNLMETSCLVNIVHNDFQDPEAIFQSFFKAGAEYAAAQGTAVNGHAN
jgi:methylenetetrahydrofolate reductase (NADPH)